jgi:serine protease Do
LGVMIEPISASEMKFFNLTSARGALVSDVEANSEAAKIGLKVGDVIVAANGVPIKGPGQLQEMTSLSAPGTHVTLKVMRNGKPMVFHAVLTTAPKQNEQVVSNHAAATQGFHLGVTVGNLTPDVRQQLHLPDNVHGAVIHSVEPGSAAANSQVLGPGVVIESINRHPVDSADQLSQLLRGLPADQPILVRFYVDGSSGFTVVHPLESVH